MKTQSQKVTHFVGNVEIIKEGSSTKYKRHIDGKVIKLVTSSNPSTDETKYLLRDHQGSVATVVTPSTLEENLCFDPWGQRRTCAVPPVPMGGIPTAVQIAAVTETTERGYTGHEMIDSVGIVHMNGRIYDPVLGRFLQADITIDGVTNSQGFNRYSYVLNNPLSLTDPSGYLSFREALGVVVGALIAIVSYGALSEVGWYVAASSAGGASAVGAAAAAGAISGFAGGFASGLITTGNISTAFESGLYSGLSGAAFAAVATSFAVEFGNANNVRRISAFSKASDYIRAGKNLYLTQGQFAGLVAAQASTGGIMATIQGGKFGHGFVSAGLSKLATPGILKIGNVAGESLASGIVGGTASSLTGGKFANGAATGALLYATNACSSAQDCWEEIKAHVKFWWSTHTVVPNRGPVSYAGLGADAVARRKGFTGSFGLAQFDFNNDKVTDTWALYVNMSEEVAGADLGVQVEVGYAPNNGFQGRAHELGGSLPSPVPPGTIDISVSQPIDGNTNVYDQSITVGAGVGLGAHSATTRTRVWMFTPQHPSQR